MPPSNVKLSKAEPYGTLSVGAEDPHHSADVELRPVMNVVWSRSGLLPCPLDSLPVVWPTRGPRRRWHIPFGRRRCTTRGGFSITASTCQLGGHAWLHPLAQVTCARFTVEIFHDLFSGCAKLLSAWRLSWQSCSRFGVYFRFRIVWSLAASRLRGPSLSRGPATLPKVIAMPWVLSWHSVLASDTLRN